MSDIIREVDEELRHERYKKLWDRFGLYVIGAALIIVLGVAGWRGWEWYAARQAAESGARFEVALQLATDGKREEAQAAFEAIAENGTAGYRTLARFRAAAAAANPKRLAKEGADQAKDFVQAEFIAAKEWLRGFVGSPHAASWAST